MNSAYCWRCQKVVAVVPEAQVDEFEKLFLACMQNIKDYAKQHPASVTDTVEKELFADFYEMYEALGGDTNCDPCEFAKHTVRIIGPQCPQCLKNFRTPEAQFCAECGYKRS